MELDLKKILSEREEQEKQKRSNEMWGAISDNVGSQQSFGNFFLGMTNPKSTSGAERARAQNARMVDPQDQALASLEMKSKTDDYGKKQDELQRAAAKRDANSAGSKAAKYFYQSKGLKVEPDDTEESLTERYGKSSDYSQAEFKAKLDAQKKAAGNGDGLTPYQRYQVEKDRRQEEQKQNEKANERTNPKLATTDKARLDNVIMALKSVERMEKALGDGENTFSVVGDNNFTLGEREWEEALGRMQSGGAINKDEGVRFRKFVPGVTDSSEMQREKLRSAREMMSQRLKTLGASPEQLASYGIDEKMLGGQPVVSQRDQEAYKWALANPKDPRASKIIETIGTKVGKR